MIRVNGHITISSTLKATLNGRNLKQNTHLKQDLCSGFTRLCSVYQAFDNKMFFICFPQGSITDQLGS